MNKDAPIRADDAILGLIHVKLTETMLAMLNSGKPLSAQDMNAIRQFLKDNEITASVEPGTPHHNLKEAFNIHDARAVGIFNLGTMDDAANG